MSGVKGRSGTNKNKDKPWVEALRVVVFSDDDDGIRKLRRVAEKCVAAAMAGDMQAIKEIGDRLDGKPSQEQTLTVRNELDQQSEQELRELIRREVAVSSGNGAALEAPEDTRVIN